MQRMTTNPERIAGRIVFCTVFLLCVVALYALAAHLDAESEARVLKARAEFCERHPSRCEPQAHNHR
jgi:hypothetical protein